MKAGLDARLRQGVTVPLWLRLLLIVPKVLTFAYRFGVLSIRTLWLEVRRDRRR